jgi:D-alanine-D-alanine ligase
MSEASRQASRRQRIRVLVLWNRPQPSGEALLEGTELDEPLAGAAPEEEGAAGGVDADAGEDAGGGPGDLTDGEERHVELRARAEQIGAALRARGFAATVVDLDNDFDRIVDAIVVERPHLIFNLVDQMYGDTTQHAAVASLYELLGIPYTGAAPFCLSSCIDRARTRLLLVDAGVPAPGYAVVRDLNAIPATDQLRPPLIVTQALDDLYHDEGTRFPIGSRDELSRRIALLAADLQLPFLVEEYLAGRRIHAIVAGNRALEVLPLTETRFDPEEELDEVIVAQLEPDTADRIRSLAQRAFRALGCRDWAQIDLVLDPRGQAHVIDIRPALDLSPGSPLDVAARCREGGFAGLVTTVALHACERNRIDIPSLADILAAQAAVVPAPPRAWNESAGAPAADAALPAPVPRGKPQSGSEDTTTPRL